MPRLATTMLLAFALGTPALAEDSPKRASPCPLEGDFQTLPSGLDVDSANRVWCWMKQQVHAPLDLAPPPVLVGALPLTKFSVFVFPTPKTPDAPFSIEIAANTVRYEDPLFVLWALAHELAHSLFTLRPFGFEPQSTYSASLPNVQHCDPEFQRMTNGAADVLWDIYHSSDQRLRMVSQEKDIRGRECAYLSNQMRIEGHGRQQKATN